MNVTRLLLWYCRPLAPREGGSSCSTAILLCLPGLSWLVAYWFLAEASYPYLFPPLLSLLLFPSTLAEGLS
ncbi:hypothetical protein CGRA01v4_05329 [Colletotrichum graminicola]|nr:hypothetical protein CGRA01v4_05329 [Colletotrichum graminicola]